MISQGLHTFHPFVSKLNELITELIGAEREFFGAFSLRDSLLDALPLLVTSRPYRLLKRAVRASEDTSPDFQRVACVSYQSDFGRYLIRRQRTERRRVRSVNHPASPNSRY